ncbi:unnamed protein product, partial [Cylicostephanus goldi]
MDLSQSDISQQGDDVVSEPEWVQSKVNASLKRGAEKAKVEHVDVDVETSKSSYEAEVTPSIKKPNTEQKLAEEPPAHEENVQTNFEGSVVSAGCALHFEANTVVDVPLLSVVTISGNVLADDGATSVQLLCEESDYATDTDTSALLRGTVQFFNRNSPLETLRSSTSLSVSQRSSKILPDAPENENDGCAEITVTVDLRRKSPVDIEEVVTQFANPSELPKTDEQDSLAATGSARTSTADETIHLVVEETLLSQMASSAPTDDTGRSLTSSPTSKGLIRETDILSDESVSVMTEISQSVTDFVDQTFTFVRADARKRLIAIVYLDTRQFARANVAADNTFD